MKRILIIGGTGMLQAATDYFITINFQVSVIGRDIQRLNYFEKKHPDKKVELISVDYRDTNDFINVIEANIKKQGAFDTVISWIHSNADNSLLKLIDVISESNDGVIFYHIKGSGQFNKRNRLFESNAIASRLIYREIFLGYKVENNASRWLTNSEISDGVIKAVESAKEKFIVGQIEPTELSP